MRHLPRVPACFKGFRSRVYEGANEGRIRNLKEHQKGCAAKGFCDSEDEISGLHGFRHVNVGFKFLGGSGLGGRGVGDAVASLIQSIADFRALGFAAFAAHGFGPVL